VNFVRFIFSLSLYLCLCLWLAGCATMTVDECKAANWGDVGLRDGLAGAALSVLNDRVKDCAEAKVAVDTPRYLQGRDQGLLQYCRIENAAPLGLNGKSYDGVCPPVVDLEFRRRYKVGRDVHVARNELNSLESRRGSAEDRLRSAANDDDRRRARDALRDLDADMRRARDRVRDAEWVLDRLR
jgi:hypothetical protein